MSLQLAGIDSFSTCLEIYDKKYGKKEEKHAEEYWKTALDEHFILPLWTTSAKDIVEDIFSDAGIDISVLRNKTIQHQGSDKQSPAFARIVNELSNTLRENFNRLILVIGLRGVGKSSAITEACKNQKLLLSPSLVNPFEFKWSDYETMLGNVAKDGVKVAFIMSAPYLDDSSETNGSLEQYAISLKTCLKQTKKAIFFVRLAVNDFPSSFIKKLLSHVRGHSAVIGVPDWSANDLRYCHDSTKMKIQVDPLLNIHIAIERFCRTINCNFFPSPSMLKMAYQLTDLRIKQNTEILRSRRVLLDGVLEKLQKWDDMIESWTNQLEKVSNLTSVKPCCSLYYISSEGFSKHIYYIPSYFIQGNERTIECSRFLQNERH